MFRHFKHPGDEHIAYRATSFFLHKFTKERRRRVKTPVYIHIMAANLTKRKCVTFFSHFLIPSIFFYYLPTFIGNTKTLHRNFVFRSKSHLIEVGFGVGMFLILTLLFFAFRFLTLLPAHNIFESYRLYKSKSQIYTDTHTHTMLRNLFDLV